MACLVYSMLQNPRTGTESYEGGGGAAMLQKNKKDLSDLTQSANGLLGSHGNQKIDNDFFKTRP
jgi:hypothetical protein